jgi:diguanylate cyclase (GGDEF)-like protein
MRSRLRETDDLARWGGEEFLLLMPLTGEEGAVKTVEEVRAAVAGSPLDWRGSRIALTMTFGVGVYDGDETLEDALNRIDQALYAGKRAGKNRVVLASRP